MRFEVFKRDHFTCQYCGAKAPDVALECDHVRPVFHDGQNAMENLTTACRDCNAGKGARRLDDRSRIRCQLAMRLDGGGRRLPRS
jgi:5-methylcytosine-specific restriction endonuclease McrA